MSLAKSAISGVKWTTLERFSRQGLQFAFLVVLARFLGPDDFGVVALAGVYIMLVETVLSLGTSTAMVQRETVRDQHKDAVFWYAVGTSIVMMGATVVLAEPLSWMLGNDELTLVLWLLAPKLLLSSLSRVQDAILVREMRFGALAIRTGGAYFIGSTLGLVLVFLGAGLFALVVQQLATALVATVVLWIACDWRPSPRFEWAALRELIPFGAKVTVNNLLHFATKKADQAVTAALLSSSALGLLASARRFSETGAEVLRQPLNVVLLPVLSRMQKEPERLANSVVRVQRVQAAAILPAFVGLACVAEPLVLLLLGDEWRAAVPLLRLVAVAEAVRVFGGFAYPVFIGSGRPGLIGRILLITGTATVVGSAAGAVFGGVLGVAVAVLAVAALGAVLAFGFAKRYTSINVRDLLRAYVGPTAAALIMAAAVVVSIETALAGRHVAIQLLGGFVVGGLSYAVALRLVGRRAWNELWELARSAARRRSGSSERAPAPDQAQGTAAELRV